MLVQSNPFSPNHADICVCCNGVKPSQKSDAMSSLLVFEMLKPVTQALRTMPQQYMSHVAYCQVHMLLIH